MTRSVVQAPTPASKLRPPKVRHAEITRDRLLNDETLEACEVLVICAPGGYGKSTLAIQWASRTGRPVAWATVDETDNDPVVLLATLSAALGQAVDGFTPPPVLTADEPAYSRQVLPGFIAAVAGIGQPVTVVIDDAHLIGAGVRTVMKAFVNALPPGSQIAIVGRSMSGVPLPLWRGQGRAVELDAQALTFRADETTEAVRSFHSDSDAQAVHEASAGWPVAVFLLSQANTACMTNVAEFIETEVLAGMPDELRNFVLDTAAIGSVNAGLAQRLSGMAETGQLLADGITTVLLSPAGDGWYHYHPLMQDCVADLLRREDPQRLRVAYARAARWHLEQGFLDAAVRFAIASEDGQTLGEVVWPAAQVALVHGRVAAVKEWLSRIGDPAIAQRPELSLASAWTNVAGGTYGRVLRDVEQTLRLMPDDWLEHPQDFSVGPMLCMLMGITNIGTDGPVAALDLAHKARQFIDPDAVVFALSTLSIGLNEATIGDPSADQTLQEAVALADDSAVSSTRTESMAMLSLLLFVQGQTTRACALAQAAEEVYAFHELRDMSATSGVLALARIALACCRGREADIRKAVADHAECSAEISRIFLWYWPLSAAVLAYASVRLDDHEAYHRYLTQCWDTGLSQQWKTLAEQAHAAVTPLSQLTPAELRVWDLLKGRMTLSEIAGALFLSRETVKSHTGAIYRKLGVASRREAQELAETWG